jgi:hypothetical protein
VTNLGLTIFLAARCKITEPIQFLNWHENEEWISVDDLEEEIEKARAAAGETFKKS